MAHNLLRKVRTQRPNTLVGLDHANPYAEGLLLKHLYNVFAPEVPDLTGHVATGVLNGAATWDVLVDPGLVLHFDQSNDYIDCGNNSYVDITSDTMSIRTRVSLEGFGTDIMDFCSKGQPWETSTGYCLYRYSDNQLYFDVYTSGSVKQCTHTTTINDGDFHWVEAIYDGSDIWIIVDGVAGTKVSCTGNIVSASQSLQIGRRYSSANYFAGHMDTFELYSVALSSDACASLRENPHQLLEKEVFHFITPTASGVTGSGALASEVGTVSGTGTRTANASGALAASVAIMAGTAEREVVGSGALVSEVATITGEGSLGITGTGALTAELASISGAAERAIIGTGALDSEVALIAGTASAGITGTGALNSEVATIAGTAVRTSVGTGALASEVATISGKCFTGYAAEVLSDNPVAYWRLGETSGTNAVEEINGNDGTYANGVTLGSASLLVDDPDPSIDLDGVDDRITVSNDSVFQITGDLSLEAIVQVSDDTKYHCAIQKDDGVNRCYGLYAGQITTGYPYVTLFIGNTPIVAYASTNIADGNPHHIVGTYDGSNLKIYIDGVVDGTTPTTGAIDNDNAIVTLGDYDGTNTGFRLAGGLDECAIYDSALTSTQITDHFNASGITGDTNGTGALASEVATISGTGVRTVNGTGALSSELATIVGSGTANITGTGALVSEVALIAGTATRTITGTGTLASDLATIVGTAPTPVTIDGSATATITTSNGTLCLYGDGSEYFTLEDRVLTTY